MCYIDGDPMSYTGLVSVSIYDYPCEDWIGPHQQNFVDRDFPDRSVAEVSNFCRNPNNAEIGPWCYIDYDEIGFCDLLWCSSVGWC